MACSNACLHPISLPQQMDNGCWRTLWHHIIKDQLKNARQKAKEAGRSLIENDAQLSTVFKAKMQ
jgi:hypothetical protein